MKVVSLFDGMSCGQIALAELGVTPEVYYASEIDKYAIHQTQLNFPNTVQLGDITKWREWRVKWSTIDLIMAGSPCQGFSFAGKQLAFDDPRSALFFVFIDILNHARSVNPKVLFLLENVRMKKVHQEVINRFVGIFPVQINSNLVSAQNRDRWYWSNIRTRPEGLFDELHTDIPQPADRGILLRDVLDSEVDEKYYLRPKMVNWLKRHATKRGTKIKELEGGEKASCLTVSSAKQNLETDYICVAMRGRNPENPQSRKAGLPTVQRLEPNTTGKTNCLTSVAKDNLVLLGSISDNGHNSQWARVYSIDGKSATLMSQGGGCGAKTGLYAIGDHVTADKWVYKNFRPLDGKGNSLMACSHKGNRANGMSLVPTPRHRIRRLTPAEGARLQTIPDWYKWECSDSQQYKMLGNSWTVEVIKHILSFIPGITTL